MKEQKKKLHKKIVKTVELDYLVFIPDNYNEGNNASFPLLMFLHGSLERGNNLEKVKVNGVPEIMAQQDFPFILVCPQCPEGTVWSDHFEALSTLVDEISKLYLIDTARMYLTGISLGGYGTWDFAMNYTNIFAAIAPICGGAERPIKLINLKNTPVWAFHGEKDDIVPVENTKSLVKELEQLGGNVKATYYPELEHDSWTETYQNPELYSWFIQHTKS